MELEYIRHLKCRAIWIEGSTPFTVTRRVLEQMTGFPNVERQANYLVCVVSGESLNRQNTILAQGLVRWSYKPVTSVRLTQIVPFVPLVQLVEQ